MISMIKKIKLIPRYNWDYGISEFIRAVIASLKRKNYENKYITRRFGDKALFTTSGRSSLYAILKAFNLPRNAGIGVPLFCCPVIFDVIKQAELVPIFIDIDIEDYNISVSDLEKKKDTLSAVIVVHMFGHPANMDAISLTLGSIPIIEDCAHALFIKYQGKEIGSLSNVSFFSFRSGKYISAGEGSAILSNDTKLFKEIKKIINEYEEWSTFSQLVHCMSTFLKSTLFRSPLYGTIGYPIGNRLDKKLNQISNCDL